MSFVKLLLPPSRMSVLEIEWQKNICWTGEIALIKWSVCIFVKDQKGGKFPWIKQASVLTQVFSAVINPAKEMFAFPFKKLSQYICFTYGNLPLWKPKQCQFGFISFIFFFITNIIFLLLLLFYFIL